MTHTLTNHLILFLPYRLLEETLSSILEAAAIENTKVTLISKLPIRVSNNFCIHKTIQISDEKRTLRHKEQLFSTLDIIHQELPFTGMVNFAEAYVEVAAELVERYRLQGNKPLTAYLTRNKFEMRKVLAKAQINVPKYANVHSFEEYKNTIQKFELPCISKPIDGASSDGVIKITAQSDLESTYFFSSQSNSGNITNNIKGVLVESYIDGQEYSVEAIVSNKQLYIMGITEKVTEEEPFFNELMHIFPAPIDNDLENEITTLTRKVVSALAIENGGVHLELKNSNKGLFVIECASRLGGDAIPLLINLAYGYPPFSYMIKSGLGHVLKLRKIKNQFAGILFIQSNDRGILTEATFDKNIMNPSLHIISYKIIAKPGDKIGRPPYANSNRIGYIIATGSNANELKEQLIIAEKSLRFSIKQV